MSNDMCSDIGLQLSDIILYLSRRCDVEKSFYILKRSLEKIKIRSVFSGKN